MNEDLSATDERILSTLNYHVIQSDYVSITTLAEECSVAKSTIVKLAKKLGYSGYSDLRSDLAQGRRDTVSETYLPLSVSETDDVLEDATRMAERFWGHRDHKNVLLGGMTPDVQLLSAYLARKLEMFGIQAVSTYDYMTIQSLGREPGVALFYEHNPAPRAERGRGFLAVSKPHFRLAQHLGYELMLVSDGSLSTPAAQMAHQTFRVKATREPHVDLFVPRTIMLFELMLSELSRLARQSGEVPATLPTEELIGTAPMSEEDDL